MTKIRVIGDIHNVGAQYINIVNTAECSIQLGDLGFDYRFLDGVDPDRHVFFPGNHDNYDKCFAYRHCLGDYGYEVLNGISFYYVRGGFSIDRDYRLKHQTFTGQKSWWAQEELSFQEMDRCLQSYKLDKPDLVITHECPRKISSLIGSPEILKNFGFNPDTFTTNTSQLLQSMFRFHKPKLWIFGHYHKRWKNTVDGTKFICLPEFGYCDVDENLDVTRLWTN